MSAEKKQNSSVKKESDKISNQKNTNTKPKTNSKQEVKPKTSTQKAATKTVTKTTTSTKPKTVAKTAETKTSTQKVTNKPKKESKTETETKTIEKTTKVEETKKETTQKDIRKSDKIIKSIVITVIIIALCVLLIWVIINAKKEYKTTSYLDTTLSSENYDEMINEFNKNMKKDEEPGYKDEYYYFNYAFNSHMFDDAASTVTQNPEENTTIPAQFKYIYGKTINDVIDEGKKLMEEKHFSLSDYVNYLNSLQKDPNLENLSNGTIKN